MDAGIKRDMGILIAVAIIMKIAIVLGTIGIFHSFMDSYDYSYYYGGAKMVMAGHLPYFDFAFDYPVFAWIPILVAYLLGGSPGGFTIIMQILMVICDILIIYGIYSIAYTIWGSKSRAFWSGLLYAISLPAAYFTMVRFDPLPVCLMVWAVWFTLKNETMKGYTLSLTGYLTKIFPVLLMPYFIIWNTKGGNQKKEIVKGVAVTALWAIPSLLVLGTFTSRIGTGGLLMANTPIYVLHMYLENVLHAGIPLNIVHYLLLAMGCLVIVGVTYAFWKARKSPVALLTTVLVVIFTILFVSKLHSPQYVLWYLPFLCLLVSDELELGIVLVVTQVLAYIEFPLMFGHYYTNAEYVHAVGTGGWWMALLFFTLELIFSIWLLSMIIKKNKPSFFAVTNP